MTALDFPTMNDEPTLAAELADAETQDCYAWSQADTADPVTTYIPRRSWKIPAAALALTATAAAVSLGAVAWPQQHTAPQVQTPTTHVPAPPPPTVKAQPQTPDQRFITLLKQRDVIVVSPPLAISGAHETCTDLAKGYSAREIAEAAVRSTPEENLDTASTFVATAQEVYCMAPAS